MFQSTFPHGERPFSSVLLTSHLQFQSTFPHGERQEYTRPATEWYGVSIHVPARGTTGSTQDSVDQYKSFNPRSRTGNDAREIMSEVLGAVSIHVPARGTTLLFYDYDDPKAVSIHVPARGTTPPSSTLIGRFLFQSTFPHGERPPDPFSFAASGYRFQSTFPHGERRRRRVDPEPVIYGFNPRSRTGNDTKCSRVFVHR